MADFPSPLTSQATARPTSALASFARTCPLTVFFVLAYAWSWTWWIIVPRVFLRGTLAFNDVLELVVFLIGACGPALAALATRYTSHRDLKICLLWAGWRSLTLGLLSGTIAIFIVAVVVPSVALVRAPLGALHWSVLLHWSTYAVNYSTFLGGPIPEEPGWRGFALPRLQARFGPYAASLFLAVLWAGWHLPLFWVNGWTSASPWQFLLILIGISFLFTGAANLSRFNVIVAVVLHASFNTSSGVSNALLQNLPKRAHEMLIYTFAVFISGTVVGVAILAIGKAASKGNSRGSAQLEHITR